jgi:hypothetical protein
MLEVLVQMAGLIVCGIGWRIFKPAGLAPVQTRKVLTSLVYYLLLPALVLSVLWKAELGNTTLLIALSAAFAIALGMSLSTLSCRACKTRPAVTGAVILAATFPNATYLGLPVLEAAFGPWARGVAIQYDLFACTPLLFTLGILVAARYGPAGTWRGAVDAVQPGAQSGVEPGAMARTAIGRPGGVAAAVDSPRRYGAVCYRHWFVRRVEGSGGPGDRHAEYGTGYRLLRPLQSRCQSVCGSSDDKHRIEPADIAAVV